MTLMELEIQQAVRSYREIVELVNQCDKVKTLNPLMQVPAVKKLAPQLEKGLLNARDSLVDLLGQLKDLQQENEKLKNQVPGQFTDRVVTIQGQEGFRWRVTL